MLGKLIKNEFVQRGKAIITVLISLLGISALNALVGLVTDLTNVDNLIFNSICGLTTALYIFALFGGGIVMIVNSVNDFGSRYFKNQGYLTHTLPVKIGTQMWARGIFDIIMVIVMFIFYPLVLALGLRDVTYITHFFELLFNSGDAEVMITSAVDGFFLVVALVLAAMMILWQLYAAYTLGHTCRKHKRVWSVICFFIIYLVEEVLIVGVEIVVYAIENHGVNTFLYDIVNNVTQSEAAIIGLLIGIDIVMFGGVIILGAIISGRCKHRLNLE